MKTVRTPEETTLFKIIFCSIGILAGLLLVIVFLLIRIDSLSRQTVDLKNEATRVAKQLDSYQRSYCINDLSITQADAVTTHSLESAGYTRSYRVHTPKNYDPTVRYPVMVSFDGMEGSATRIQSYSGVDSLPVIAVYPEALPGNRGFTAWEGAPYAAEGTRDIQFVADLLETLPSQYCTDATQTFAVGMSNGGGFALLAGCALSDKIRAVASVSGAYYRNCQNKGRTPSLMVVHSKADKQVPFLGSKPRKLPELPQWVERKASERKCQTSTQTNRGGALYYRYYGCKDNSQLQFVVLSNQEHGWLRVPGAPVNTPGMAESIWEFFRGVVTG